jgi:YspA, cpYpsA-related SLOG family
MFKVIVAGGRDFNDYELLKRKMLYYLNNFDLSEVEIVSGTARGADRLGERFACEFGCKLKQFPANWKTYGKQAGYLRNMEMAKYADACVCFWNGVSRGTKHMIGVAKKEGLKVRVVRYDLIKGEKEGYYELSTL